jgi:ribosomal protein L29
MDIKDLKKKEVSDLQKLLQEKKKELTLISFDMKMGKIKNIKAVANLKKDIAKIITVVNQNSIS